MASKIKRKLYHTDEFKDVRLEKKFLGGVVHNPQVFRRIIQQLDSKCFTSSKLRKIYERIVDFYHQEGVIVNNDKSFDLVLEVSNEKREAYRVIWKSLKQYKKYAKDDWLIAAKNKLVNLANGRKLLIGMKSTYEDLKKAQQGDDAGFASAINELTSTVSSIKVSEVPVRIMNPVDSFDDFVKLQQRIKNNPDEYIGIPTGIKELDKRIMGLRPAEIGLLTAATGVGKSIFLLDIATYCWQNVGDVAFVTIEMPASQIRERFYCRLSGIEYENFRYNKLTDEHIKHLRKKIEYAKQHEHKFHIIDIPESGTIQSIKAELETIMKNNDIRLVVIDYLNIIRANTSNAINLEWSKQIEVIIDMKQQIARYFHLPVWTANQVQGAKGTKEALTTADMAFAKNIADNVDIGVYVSPRDDTEVTGIMNMGFTKKRDFKGSQFEIQTDRDRMRFSKRVVDKVKEEKKSKLKERKVKV